MIVDRQQFVVMFVLDCSWKVLGGNTSWCWENCKVRIWAWSSSLIFLSQLFWFTQINKDARNTWKPNLVLSEWFWVTWLMKPWADLSSSVFWFEEMQLGKFGYQIELIFLWLELFFLWIELFFLWIELFFLWICTNNICTEIQSLDFHPLL